MSAPQQRIAAVFGDFDAALRTLLSVLDHIKDTAPPPEIRVVMLNSSIVSLTSMVEEAIRNQFQAYLKVLQETHADFRWLRVELQRSNLKAAIDDLKKISVPKDVRLVAGAASNLSTCFSGAPGYNLSLETLTYNQGNFRSLQITDIAKSCGIKEIFVAVCDCADVETYLGEPDLETRKERFIARWNEIFDERDTVVHRLSQASGWSDEKIREAAALSVLLMQRLSAILTQDAENLMAHCAAREADRAT